MALSNPPFLRTRNGKIATVVGVILIVGAIVALSWIFLPDFYTALGLRHDASLEKYVDALHAIAVEQHPNNLTTWQVAWSNNTAVKVSWAFTYPVPGNATDNQTRLVNYEETFLMTNFFGTKQAADHVASISSNYTLMNTTTAVGGAYERAFGHPPSTLVEYNQIDKVRGNFIWQLDKFVQVGSLTRTYKV